MRFPFVLYSISIRSYRSNSWAPKGRICVASALHFLYDKKLPGSLKETKIYVWIFFERPEKSGKKVKDKRPDSCEMISSWYKAEWKTIDVNKLEQKIYETSSILRLWDLMIFYAAFKSKSQELLRWDIVHYCDICGSVIVQIVQKFIITGVRWVVCCYPRQNIKCNRNLKSSIRRWGDWTMVWE